MTRTKAADANKIEESNQLLPLLLWSFEEEEEDAAVMVVSPRMLLEAVLLEGSLRSRPSFSERDVWITRWVRAYVVVVA